jgi:peptidoglycan/LPS O-acetylase OafA/YrhL
MRLTHIDVLRGIAAVMVTLFHLTGSTVLKTTLGPYAHFGFLGVQIFFIISGFVLPFSMFKSNYSIKNFPGFMVSRIVRIYPAYMVSIAIGVIMAILTHRNDFTLSQILGHLIFFSNAVSPVFWTLAIEFQFYILIGLLPVLFSHKLLSNIALVGLTAGSLYFSQDYLIFHWFPFFALGILSFNKVVNRIPAWLNWLSVSIVILIIYKSYGVVFVSISILTVLAILYLKINESKFGALLVWVGTISYSLYLTHWELGRAAISAARRIPVLGQIDLVRLAIGIGMSVFTAWLLFKFVEKPALTLCKKYKKRFNLKNT